MKKIFKNVEIVNIVEYFNQLKPDVLDEIPLKIRWNLKKNIDKIKPMAVSYENFRNECVVKLQKEWFNEERSEKFMKTKVDANGNPVLDVNGNEITEPQRRIKKEYIDQYTKAVGEINEKLIEIGQEDNEIEISTFDMDAFVDSLPDDTKIEFDTLTMLSFMDTTTNVKEEQ